MDLYSIPRKFPETLPDYKGVAFIGDPHLEAAARIPQRQLLGNDLAEARLDSGNLPRTELAARFPWRFF